MELLCNFRICRHDVDKLSCRILGMARHKPEEKIARKRREPSEQLCKIAAVIAVFPIGVDVLSEQGDLLAAALDKRPCLG